MLFSRKADPSQPEAWRDDNLPRGTHWTLRAGYKNPLLHALGSVFHQLQQHATGAGRMYKYIEVTAGADFDLVGNEARARRLQALDGGRQIVDMQGDVVQAFAALGQELGDRRLRRSRLKQLDAALARRHHRQPHSFSGDR